MTCEHGQTNTHARPWSRSHTGYYAQANSTCRHTHTDRHMQTCVLTYIHAWHVHSMTCIAHRHLHMQNYCFCPQSSDLLYPRPLQNPGISIAPAVLGFGESPSPTSNEHFLTSARSSFLPVSQRMKLCATGGSTDAWLAHPILPAPQPLSPKSTCPP